MSNNAKSGTAKKMRFAMGQEFLRSFVEALGLGGRAIRRAVLDIDAYGVVTVYLEEFVDAGKLSALLGQIPNIQKEIVWCDRIGVENADGTKVVIKQLDTGDNLERNYCKQLIERMKNARPEELQRIGNFLFNG